MNNYRHGDVSLHQTQSLPDGLQLVEHNGSFAIALGEVTGHRHLVTVEKPEHMTLYLDPSTNLYVLNLTAPAKISHEEHATITLEPGIYIQKQEIATRSSSNYFG
jgi:hypothetical protein